MATSSPIRERPIIILCRPFRRDNTSRGGRNGRERTTRRPRKRPAVVKSAKSSFVKDVVKSAITPQRHITFYIKAVKSLFRAARHFHGDVSAEVAGSERDTLPVPRSPRGDFPGMKSHSSRTWWAYRVYGELFAHFFLISVAVTRDAASMYRVFEEQKFAGRASGSSRYALGISGWEVSLPRQLSHLNSNILFRILQSEFPARYRLLLHSIRKYDQSDRLGCLDTELRFVF